MFELKKKSKIEVLPSSFFSSKGLEVFIKREDQIDREISGNKWRKLKYNFIEAQSRNQNRILTFGGAFSNHIAAMAAAANRYGFESIGIIRGDELHEQSNPTLQKAHQNGMKLIFISRSEYKKRENQNWSANLAKEHDAFLVPEGGTNQLALKGVKEMVEEIEMSFDFIICPVGTGGTLAGIVNSLNENQKAIGIAALKGHDYLASSVNKLLDQSKIHNWHIFDDYCFGGYAKYDSTLVGFIRDFKRHHGIQLEPVYSGKMMYGLFDLISQNHFPQGSKIITIHTGGLQGIEGFNEKMVFL